MKRKIILLSCFIALGSCLAAQQPVARPVRVADSLTAKEMAERNPVLLRSELDSLIKLYTPVKKEVQGKILQADTGRSPMLYTGIGLLVLLLISGLVLAGYYRQKKTWKEILNNLKGQQPSSLQGGAGARRNGKKGAPVQSPEDKIEVLNAELNKLLKENEGLQGVIKEYNGIQHEYESLRYAIRKAYKVRNYPGYDNTQKESSAIRTVLETEKAVADYAYEKFLRPLLALTDANKNSPAKMNAADSEKIVDLLISLSFLYIEYLYLRVSDLVVGGTIVERIRSMAAGNTTGAAALKKLNTELGSRALVMRMTLDKAAVSNLTYPVFDETNLNTH